MKKIFLAISVTAILAGLNFSCNLIDGQKQEAMSKEDSLAAVANAPIIEFEREVFDFGTLVEGDTVSHAFKFKNVSTKPIVVENATASCGCTTPEWAKTPILAAKSSEIKAGFNAASAGPFEKTITVKLQGIALPVELKIKGEVVASATPAKAEKQR